MSYFNIDQVAHNTAAIVLELSREISKLYLLIARHLVKTQFQFNTTHVDFQI